MTRLLCLTALVCVGLSENGQADDGKQPISDSDKQAVEKLLVAFEKTPFAERGVYVTDPKEYGELREAYYKGRVIPDEAQATVNSAKRGPKERYLTVVATHKATLDGNKSTWVVDWYIVNTKDGLKVDWGASIGYNPVGFTAWAAGKDETLTLRVEAQLSDFYMGHYENAKDTHYSVKMTEAFGDRLNVFHGYVKKDSKLGKRLFEILKDEQKHKLTITFERNGTNTNYLGVKELVSESWVK